MPARLPLDDEFRTSHYLEKARREGECLCIGNGRYRPTWHPEHGGRQVRGTPQRIANLVCRTAHGPSLKGKTYVLHSCDNIACINPDHLRWGAQSENIKQAVDRGRMSVPVVDQAKRARDGKHKWAKLTPNDVVLIRTRLVAGEIQATIAADCGVTFQTISKIKLGQRWAHS